jgi:peptidoglycan/LPS O-acetylase OafA/YrhL
VSWGERTRDRYVSGAIYILHVPIFCVFVHFVPEMWDSATLFWPYLGTLLVASMAVYKLVEEPARRALSPGQRGRAADAGAVGTLSGC